LTLSALELLRSTAKSSDGGRTTMETRSFGRLGRISALTLARGDERADLHPALPGRDRPQPAQWLLRQRVDHARHMLETTDLGVDQIAQRCGFGTAAALRQQLRRAIGVAPSTYRRSFRVPVGSG
jgi:AraC-like DNA-binding protein